MFYIRVDANQQIATGHLQRCLSIAKGLDKRGCEVTFVTADEQPQYSIESNGFPVVCLDSKWDDMDSELEAFQEILRIRPASHILVDSYYVTETYFKALVPQGTIIYIDDINLFPYPVDVLINYNNYYDLFHYEQTYQNTGTKLLLGPQYAPLREEFQHVKYEVRETVERILITTGGTDNYNVAGKLLDYINANKLFESIEFHVVVGSFNKNLGMLQDLESKRNNLFLHQNVTRMSDLMTQCDLAVSAGGSTLYELCACGVPTVCFSFADNQLNGVRAFEEKGIMEYAGDIRKGEGICIKMICEKIENMILKVDRKGISKRMQSLVDGKGVERIVSGLEEWA